MALLSMSGKTPWMFCFNWNEMHPHAFKMERDGHWEILTPHTRLSKLLLDEGEQLHFLYDTKGNKWEHTLTVEAIQWLLPLLVAGRTPLVDWGWNYQIWRLALSFPCTLIDANFWHISCRYEIKCLFLQQKSQDRRNELWQIQNI